MCKGVARHENEPHKMFSFFQPTKPSSSSVGGGSDHRKPGTKRSYTQEEDNEKRRKKMEHREMERKRRQDMSNLYASLRSLLPLHFIKGRRSTSEHMNQAVNYIKYLQENIKCLNSKRDELKRICSVTDSGSVILKKNINSESTVDCSKCPITVTVSCKHGGIEILIQSYTRKEGFPISRVIKALLLEGLDVMSCNFSKVNGMLFHSIHSEVHDDRSAILVSTLQQKLVDLVVSF